MGSRGGRGLGWGSRRWGGGGRAGGVQGVSGGVVRVKGWGGGGLGWGGRAPTPTTSPHYPYMLTTLTPYPLTLSPRMDFY